MPEFEFLPQNRQGLSAPSSNRLPLQYLQSWAKVDLKAQSVLTSHEALWVWRKWLKYAVWSHRFLLKRHPLLKAGDSMISSTFRVKTKRGHRFNLIPNHGSLHLSFPPSTPLGLPEPYEKKCTFAKTNIQIVKDLKKKRAASWPWLDDVLWNPVVCSQCDWSCLLTTMLGSDFWHCQATQLVVLWLFMRPKEVFTQPKLQI